MKIAIIGATGNVGQPPVAGGKSRISYQHCAIALLDQIQTPAHSRQRFTVGD